MSLSTSIDPWTVAVLLMREALSLLDDESVSVAADHLRRAIAEAETVEAADDDRA
jgi:hypothetical protein